MTVFGAAVGAVGAACWQQKREVGEAKRLWGWRYCTAARGARGHRRWLTAVLAEANDWEAGQGRGSGMRG